MKTKDMKKLLLVTALTAAFATGCGTTPSATPAGDQSAVTTSEASETTVPTRTSTPQFVPSTPISGNPASVREAFPDADIIELIGDNLYVAVDYDFKNDSTEFFVYDSDKENVINHLSVPDCSFSFIPEVYPGEGFGIASGFTSQDVTGYFYSISENDYSEFKFDIDKKWNYWGNAAFAADGSAMYVTIDDKSICACGYNFNPDFTTKIMAAYSDGRESEVIEEYDHHTSVTLVGTNYDGRLIVAYTEDPNDYPKLTHQEYERLEMQSMISNQNDTSAPIENGLAFIDPDVNGDHTLDKFAQTPERYRNITYRRGAVIYSTDNGIVRVAPDSNGVYKEVRYDITDAGYKGYEEMYVSTNGEYVVFSTREDNSTDSTLYVIHFNEDAAETVTEKSLANKKIVFEKYYGPMMLDEVSGDFYAKYNDTTTDEFKLFPYQLNIFE